MQPSSTLCRAREAHHRALAGAALLDNVRTIANAAATAWAKEANAAEHREKRKLRAAALQAGQHSRSEPTSEDRGLSENPDRGFASHELVAA